MTFEDSAARKKPKVNRKFIVYESNTVSLCAIRARQIGHLSTRGASRTHRHMWPHGTHATRAACSKHTTHSAGFFFVRLSNEHEETRSRVREPRIAPRDISFKRKLPKK